MDRLRKNIINQHGENGKKWLDALPDITNIIAQEWQLTEIKPVNKMRWNYVALATQANHLPAVLKIGYDKNAILDEFNTLIHFKGNAAIQALNYHSHYNAILLEQAIPGNPLKVNHSLQLKDKITIYGRIITTLSTCGHPQYNHPHLKDWCKVIDEINDSRIPRHYAEKAKDIKNHLLSTVEHEYLCHGDLHLENIIQNDSNWLAIDPKGIIGEIAFEASAFDLMEININDDTAATTQDIIEIITLLSTELKINNNRLLYWIFVRVIMSAQWFIEDNGDPSQMLKMATYLYPLVEKNHYIMHQKSWKREIE